MRIVELSAPNITGREALRTRTVLQTPAAGGLRSKQAGPRAQAPTTESTRLQAS